MIILQFFQDAIIQARQIMDDAYEYCDNDQLRKESIYMAMVADFTLRGVDINNTSKWTEHDKKLYNRVYFSLYDKYISIRADYKPFWWVK